MRKSSLPSYQQCSPSHWALRRFIQASLSALDSVTRLRDRAKAGKCEYQYTILWSHTNKALFFKCEGHESNISTEPQDGSSVISVCKSSELAGWSFHRVLIISFIYTNILRWSLIVSLHWELYRCTAYPLCTRSLLYIVFVLICDKNCNFGPKSSWDVDVPITWAKKEFWTSFSTCHCLFVKNTKPFFVKTVYDRPKRAIHQELCCTEFYFSKNKKYADYWFQMLYLFWLWFVSRKCFFVFHYIFQL